MVAQYIGAKGSLKYIDPEKTKVELSCRPAGCVLKYFRSKYGDHRLRDFIESTGMTLEYLEDENNWISYSYFKSLLKALVDYTNDPNAPFEAGTYTAIKGLWGFLQSFYTLLGTPRSLYGMVVKYASLFSKNSKWDLVEVGENRATIRFSPLPGYPQDKNNCKNIQGQMAAIPTYWGLPLAKVMESQCAAQGSDSCVYEVSWTNRPKRMFEILGLILGGVLAGLTIKLTKGTLTYSHIADSLMVITFPLIGYFVGRLHAFEKSIEENTEVAEEQNEALMKSIEQIEKLNLELQKRVEQRTAELNLSNEELEKALIDLKNSQERLVQSEKMASIGVLAAGMAHELNNPVAAIRASIQDVLEDTSEDDTRWESLKGAEKSTERCKRIISDLLTFSLESKVLRLQGINDIVDEAVTIAQKERTNPGIRISKELDLDLPKMNVDALQIRQVLMNMISNASQAIKEEGEVIVRTSEDTGNILIEVSDTGEGIPKEIQKTIFDPFFTTKAPGAGMGLGLSISYSIIKRYNGDILVKSGEGKGTTFTIALPMDEKGK